MPDIRDIEIIAPHFKRRLSGVTSTIIQLVPRQIAAGVKIATLGPGLPDNLPKMTYRQLAGLWRALPAADSTWRPRIWHARRNVEMLAGIALRDILRMKIKLLFTSASQRRHTRYSRWLISKMDHVVATSAKTGSYLQVPHTTVLHGIDTARFHPAEDRQRPRLRIGCAGRIRHQKGTDLFIDALIALLPRYPDWDGEAIGRVTSEHQGFADELRRKIAAAGLSGRLRLTEETTAVDAWYRTLDLYVAPSRTEGFGLTPLEAMASGMAVIAGDVGAYPEIIVSGKTGAVVPTGDLAAYVAAIEPYLADPDLARRHGDNALAHVRSRFDIGNEVIGLSAVYDALASSGT